MIVPLHFQPRPSSFGCYMIDLRRSVGQRPPLIRHHVDPIFVPELNGCAPHCEHGGLIHFRLPDLDPMAAITLALTHVVGPFTPYAPMNGGPNPFEEPVRRLLNLRDLYNRGLMTPLPGVPASSGSVEPSTPHGGSSSRPLGPGGPSLFGAAPGTFASTHPGFVGGYDLGPSGSTSSGLAGSQAFPSSTSYQQGSSQAAFSGGAQRLAQTLTQTPAQLLTPSLMGGMSISSPSVPASPYMGPALQGRPGTRSRSNSVTSRSGAPFQQDPSLLSPGPTSQATSNRLYGDMPDIPASSSTRGPSIMSQMPAGTTTSGASARPSQVHGHARTASQEQMPPPSLPNRLPGYPPPSNAAARSHLGLGTTSALSSPRVTGTSDPRFGSHRPLAGGSHLGHGVPASPQVGLLPGAAGGAGASSAHRPSGGSGSQGSTGGQSQRRDPRRDPRYDLSRKR